MAKMYKISTDEPLLDRLKPLSDFLKLEKLRTIISDLYEPGDIPHKLLYEVINN
jgi:hypothetical protein